MVFIFFIVSVGYPPRIIEAPPNKALCGVGIKNSDTITLVESTMGPSLAIATDERMVIREMPDDNSCLFNSVAYVCENKSRQIAHQMRQIAASIIMQDPGKYTEAVLGKSREAYTDWIMLDTSWGGAIELAIFSSYFQLEIASIDVQTGRIDIFGSQGC
jgi:ubiquitin thioesterase OTU1